MKAVFGDRARLQGMLDFEAGLARAQSALSVIPADAAPAIAAQADASLYDMADIGRKAVLGGNLAIPLVKALTERVDGDAKRYVHWGATSQDVIDTGLMLQIREGLSLLEDDLTALADACAMLADAHRATPMVGRSFMQHGLPMPFGLKAAGWLEAAHNAITRLARLRKETLALQFGGAVGTLASLGEDGARVRDRLASDLDLHAPATPWFTLRDRLVEITSALGITAGLMNKIAGDIVLMMQTEVGEVFEPAAPGKGGSSTMPHKRNPVGAATARGAALQAQARAAAMFTTMDQQHERAVGGWQAEWGLVPELFVLTAASIAPLASALAGLEVDAERMRANLEITGGLVFAEAAMMKLAPDIGRMEAHHVVEAACKTAIAEKRHLRDVLGEDETVAARLDSAALEALFEPMGYVGSSATFIDRALAAWAAFTKKA
ncbi:3-carboxy-cis,cis-muconate cycloisomerase [Breoghania sp. L-A4]|uniref:3-carboxy-cis,cis-muconate cycloisomerase n=1 Tax=Breoghania sp. L-A4 TaxID=2304600 RepID=UPI0020C0263F|nr:3-carboxy-cis,cis-muconate cycloisomerase [Breoghania sp. L-A4]